MRIIIKQSVYDKVMHWVNKADFEVSGFGKVIRHVQPDGDSIFEVVDAHMIKQTGSAATTDLDDAALARLMYQTKDTPGELKWWWHSHVKMATFWSGTDTKTIEQLGVQGWIVATVFNQKYENKSALCYRTESIFGYNSFIYDDMDFQIIRDSETVETWDKEFDESVTKAPAYGNYSHMRQPSMLDNDFIGGNSVNHPPALRGNDGSDDKDSYAINMGILGYGITFEAMALGMSYGDYRKALIEDNIDVMKDLLTKLLALESTGKLEYGY